MKNSHWEQKRLGDVCQVEFSGVDKHIQPNEHRVFLFNYMDAYYKDCISDSSGLSKGTVTDSEYNKFRLRKDDVIITKDSETPEDIAKSCLCTKDLDDVVCGYHLAVLLPNPSVIDGGFLKRYFDLPRTQHYFSSVANGATRFGLTKPSIENATINLPPLPEQKRIVRILETWDGAIENLNQSIRLKSVRLEGLKSKLLEGKLRLPGFTEPWHHVEIGDFAESVTRVNTEDHNYPVLSCTKYDGLVRSLEYFGRKVYGNDLSKYKIVERGEFAYATNHIEEGSIGYQDICDNALTSPMYTVFKTDPIKVDDYFMYHLLKTPRMVYHYQSNMSGSIARRGGLRWNTFATLPVFIPNKLEQTAIANVIQTGEQEIDQENKKMNLLKKQRAYFLNNLVTGKLPVPEEIEA